MHRRVIPDKDTTCVYCNYTSKDPIELRRHEAYQHGYHRDAEFRKRTRRSNIIHKEPDEVDKEVFGSMRDIHGQEIPIFYKWKRGEREYQVFALLMGKELRVVYNDNTSMFTIPNYENYREEWLEELRVLREKYVDELYD